MENVKLIRFEAELKKDGTGVEVRGTNAYKAIFEIAENKKEIDEKINDIANQINELVDLLLNGIEEE